jgi:hypothetical protein
MPTFVIHALNQEPKKASYAQGEVTIGREADNDLALAGKTVSRHHAMFVRTANGWVARCVSETNPLVVDGAMTRTEVEVTEGSEVLVGGDYLLVFVEEEKNAASYMGGEKKYYTRVACDRCGWAGLMSGVRAQPVCPGCGNVNLDRGDAYDHTKEADKAEAGATAFVDRNQVRAAMDQLKTAKMSRVERADGKSGGATRKELTERETLVISKGTTTGLKLFGIVFGEGIKISWNGKNYLAESSLSFPSMKVNGTKESTCRLKNGDLVEVGSNRFKFVTE